MAIFFWCKAIDLFKKIYKIQVFENVEGCFANMRYIPDSLNLHSFLPYM